MPGSKLHLGCAIADPKRSRAGTAIVILAIAVSEQDEDYLSAQMTPVTEPLTVPQICRACFEHEDFWEEGPRGLYAFVQFGETTHGFEGTAAQVLRMNAYLIRQGSEARFVALRHAPPLAHSAKKPE